MDKFLKKFTKVRTSKKEENITSSFVGPLSSIGSSPDDTILFLHNIQGKISDLCVSLLYIKLVDNFT
jgi:hypothetical protein